MRLLAISGSLRADSHNSRLLRIAAEEAPVGVDIDIYEGLAGIPPYDEDNDKGFGPGPVRELRELVARAAAASIARARVEPGSGRGF